MSSVVSVDLQPEPALLVRLRPSSPWRIGPDSGDRDRVDRIYHSDALYAAVTSAMARLGHLSEWLDATARAAQPAVRFSSCFPFHGDLLYAVPPRHLWPPPASSKIRWKSATFVPLSVVSTLLAGETLREDAWVIDSASECLIPASAPAGSGLFRASVRSNAAIDRAGAGAFAHSTACLEFTPGSGLWFAAVFSSDEAKTRWQSPLEGAIRLLADSGFGGERSRGWGRSEMPEFSHGNWPSVLMKPARQPKNDKPAAGLNNKDEPVTKDEPFKDDGKATAHWMLSLYHPHGEDQVDWTIGSYTVATRGGRIESDAGWGQAKNSTRMITEGSLLVSSGPLRGTAPDVAPAGFAHPVYRAGFAVAVPVHYNAARAQGLISQTISVEMVPETKAETPAAHEKVEPQEIAPETVPVETESQSLTEDVSELKKDQPSEDPTSDSQHEDNAS